jgi:Cu(I)/Ag(I) efflux system periplasmic protein CusF
MKFRIAMIAVLGAALAAPASAQKPSADHSAHHAGAQAALVDGEIRKVDKHAKKITIKHGPLPDLDMPAMTMVFQVKDPAMLEKVKAGDKVKFEAQKLGGAYTVTKIEATK